MAGLSHCAAQVRRHDHDRYLTTLFVPAARRAAVFALYALNIEVARTRETVSEPLLGEIRLTWWREAIDELSRGVVREHPVLQALAEPLREHALTPALFDRMIEARRFDLSDEPPATLRQLEDYAAETTATLMALVQQVLGQRDGPAHTAARHVGIAWSLLGLVRAVPFHARAGRLYLPADLLDAAGVARRDVLELRPTPGLSAVIGEIAAAVERRLGEARQQRPLVPETARPGLLVATLADGYLRALRRAGNDPFRLRPVLPGRPVRLLLAALRY